MARIAITVGDLGLEAEDEDLNLKEVARLAQSNLDKLIKKIGPSNGE